MLVPFVIDAESLTPDPDWTPTTLKACHYQLLDSWRRVGLLLHDGQRYEDSTLKHAVDKLPQNLKSLWTAMLERSPSVPCVNDWNGSVVPSLVQDLCSVAALALVEDARAEGDFGFAEEQDETALIPTEARRFVVCRLQAMQQASVIRDALAISQRNIEAGEPYLDIWNSRFRSLAAAPSPAFKNISIVDRFAMSKHFKCPQNRLSGLERFLRLLDEDAGGPRHVSVYSAWADALTVERFEEIETEMNAVVKRLPKKNVKRLTVQMVPNGRFGIEAQDRYVRFGRYVWELGHGLEIFEGPVADRLCQASVKTDTESHSKVEKELTCNTKPFPMRIP